MSKERFDRVIAEFRRSLPAILEGKDPHKVNDYRAQIGLPPLERP